MRSLLILGLALSLGACDPGASTVGPSPDVPFAIKDKSVTNPMTQLHFQEDREAVLEMMRYRHEEGTRPAIEALYVAITDAQTWQDGDRHLRRFLADPHSDPAMQSAREQTIGSGFLHGHLVNNEPLTPAKQEAIAFYATLVIENRDVQGTPRLGPALDRLEGYWPEAKLAEARQIVAEARDTRDQIRHAAEQARTRGA